MRGLPVFVAGLLLACAGVGSIKGLAQSCQDQLRLGAARTAAVTVSARELRIPEKAWQHFEKACAAAEAHQYDTFEHEAGKALALAPDLTEIYVLRALLQVHLQQYEAAFSTIAAARRIRPDLPWSSVVVAGALSNLHRFDEASKELDRAGGAEIERWQWKFEKARAEVGKKNVEGALRWSERALAEAPLRCSDVHVLRVNALILAGRVQESVPQMEEYLRLPGDLRYRNEVVRLLEKTRDVLRQGERSGLVDATE